MEILVFGMIIGGMVASLIAAAKGRGFLMVLWWFVMGMIFGIFAWIFIAFRPARNGLIQR